MAVAVLVWALVPALAAEFRRSLSRLPFLVLVIWSGAGVFAASGGLRRAVIGGFPGDSLFTLDPAEQAVVVLIAATLTAAGLWASFRLTVWLARGTSGPTARAGRFAANLALTLGGYAVATVLAPQIFYTYYRSIIEGLPDQWVVKPAYQLDYLAAALLMRPGASIAETATGLVFWTLCGLTISVHALAYVSRDRNAS